MPCVWFDQSILRRIGEHLRQSQGAFSRNTERARCADLNAYSAWCAAERRGALPAQTETVSAFVDQMSRTKSPATVRRYVSSISWLHRAAGLTNPCDHSEVRFALRRMHRSRGRRSKQKRGLTRDLIDRMLTATDGSLMGLRDRALLSVAYDSLCRRGELVMADVGHIQMATSGSGSLFLPTSKTDQEGNGAYRYLAPDTMAHLCAYLEAAGHSEGPLFRRVGRGGRRSTRLAGDTVARIFKRMAEDAGIVSLEISGHSTRIGKAQDCVAAGIGVAAIMRDGGWKTEAMVARYAEHLRLDESASARLTAMQGRTAHSASKQSNKTK